MKKFDLESKIKSVRVPERDGEFWQTLPQRVLARAQAAPAPKPRASFFRHSLFAILNAKSSWAFRTALACLILGLCLWQSRMPQTISRALLRDGREMRQALAQLPQHLDTLMRDEHGLHNLIQDAP